jgi:nitrite reductase/ring-hydroxylating ferredoxin subunit
MTPRPPIADCAHAVDRREFMRQAAVAAAAVLVGLGAAPSLFASDLPSVAARGAAGATRVYAIPAIDGASIDAENEVLLIRWAGRAYAFALACPHRGTPLEWHASECRVFCPKHKARFRPDGAHDSGRKTRSLDRYDLRRTNQGLVVQLDARRQVDQDPAAWEAATVSLA